MSGPSSRSAVAQAVALVEDGTTVGLGTGLTVAHLVRAHGEHGPAAAHIVTSRRTERWRRGLASKSVPSDRTHALDVAPDGQDRSPSTAG
jgi:ribose 5-phosphate isomerase A